MKRGEDLLLSTRSVSSRVVESVLLVAAIALGIGAAGAGIAMMAGTASQSKKLLALPEYREIVVSTRTDTEEMDIPAIAISDDSSDVVLTTIDLKAADEAPDVRYAYVANRTRFHLGDFQFGRGQAAGQNTDGTGSSGADSGGAGSPDTGDDGSDRTADSSDSENQAEMSRFDELDGYEVSPEFFASNGMNAAEGSLFTADDMISGEPMLIYGAALARDMNGAVGEQIMVRGEMRTVVGILAPTGTNYDKMAFAPTIMLDLQGLTEVPRRYRRWGSTLRFSVDDVNRLEQARSQLETWFSRTYGPGAISITVPRAEAEAAKIRASRLAAVVLFLSLAGLFIAAVNVSNILYSRMVRRHRDVGILKALGASMRDVFRLFFSEAMLLGVLGAAVGIGVSVLLSRLMVNTLGFEKISVIVLALGIIGAWLLTVILTVFPALQAARVPAAEAMRE